MWVVWGIVFGCFLLYFDFFKSISVFVFSTQRGVAYLIPIALVWWVGVYYLWWITPVGQVEGGTLMDGLGEFLGKGSVWFIVVTSPVIVALIPGVFFALAVYIHFLIIKHPAQKILSNSTLSIDQKAQRISDTLFDYKDKKRAMSWWAKNRRRKLDEFAQELKKENSFFDEVLESMRKKHEIDELKKARNKK